MEKIIKKSQPVVWLAAILLSLFFVACTGTTDNNEVIRTDTMVPPAVVEPATVMPLDTLPPLDSSTTQRPVPIKSKQ